MFNDLCRRQQQFHRDTRSDKKMHQNRRIEMRKQAFLLLTLRFVTRTIVSFMCFFLQIKL